MKTNPIDWIVRFLLPRVIAISAAMLFAPAVNQADAQVFPLLTDPGFNNPPANSPTTYVAARSTPVYNTWGIESGAFVPFYLDRLGPFRIPIRPKEGTAMMRMDAIGGVVTQAIQLTNVSAPNFQTAIGSGQAFVDLSACFNVPRLAAGADGYVSLRFYNTLGRAAPASAIAAFGASNPSLDRFRNTWEMIGINNVQVPAGTVRIDAEVGFNNSSLNGLVGLVDAASMNLTIVPEPTGVSLVCAGAVAFVGCARRRRR